MHKTTNINLTTKKRQKSPPIWLWFLAFLISILGIFIFGIYPEYLTTYWQYLLTYNIIIIVMSVFYIIRFLIVLNKRKKQDIIGSKFALSLAKIIPILTLIPVLSFYLFSFQTIQDNLNLASKSIESLNTTILSEVDNIKKDFDAVEVKNYIDKSATILETIYSFVQTKSINTILTQLAKENNICQLLVFLDGKKIASSKVLNDCDIWDDYKIQNKTYKINKPINKNTIFTQLPLHLIVADDIDMVLGAFYKKNQLLSSAVLRLNNFQNGIKNSQITLNATIIKRQFLLDFSSTIILTILSMLFIVLKVVEKIMIPLNNLSHASQKISKGEYGVLVAKNQINSDIDSLINEFNAMSLKIKKSKQDIDNKNLYLETIIKYSSGIITTNKKFEINLLNSQITKIFQLKNNYFGLKIFKMNNIFRKLIKNFTLQDSWTEIIEFENLSLDIQGTALKNDAKIIGYLIIIKDISDMKKIQKLQIWNEVARRVAHEIKNPLNPILLSAQRLRNKFLPDNDNSGVIDKTTNTIITQVNSISTMISSLANYNDMPRLIYKLQNLNDIIKASVSLYDEEHNIILNLQKLPDLKLDTHSINRVLINLLKNSIEAKADKIIINTKCLDNQVLLEIIDNGSGFESSIINQVFDPYITNKKTGSGLGMAIVEKIILKHNGMIKIDKNQTTGAKIIITFKL